MTDTRSGGVDESALTIAELARLSEVPARTIRYYQSEGLLPRPSHRSGQAIYDRVHLDRLQAIAALRARGLRLRTIRTVLGESGEPNARVVDLLGPAIAGAAWLATSARTVDEGELADLLGPAYPDRVGQLVSCGYLERRQDPGGRGVWFVPSIPQLRGALELLSIGSDLVLSKWSSDTMQSEFGALCELFVARWIAESGRRYSGTATREDLEPKLELIRAVAWQSAAHVMAQEMGRAIRNADKIRARVEAGEFDFGADLDAG